MLAAAYRSRCFADLTPYIQRDEVPLTVYPCRRRRRAHTRPTTVGIPVSLYPLLPSLT